jgi:predicted metal-dependent hydrolase
MYQITINNVNIDVVRKDIKNIHLAVYPPTGRVRIAAPLAVNEDAVRLFAISKLGWIKRNQRKFEGQERISVREYKERESHYFQGRRYLLKIIEKDSPPRIILKSKTYLEMYTRPGLGSLKRHEIMTEWYRCELKKLIPPLIEKWEKIIGVSVNDWRVKQMKTQWGSCNITSKRIWLNLELAKKPEQCLEYIIVHEMIHLLERNHNSRFLTYMDTFLPAWQKVKQELNSLPVSHASWSY